MMGAAAIGVIAMINPSLLPRTSLAAASATDTPESASLASMPTAPPAPIAIDPASIHAVVDRTGAPLQCAIYARQRTGLELSGDARNWWPQSEGRYRRSATPSVGSVIVMGGTDAGHVAVVTQVLSDSQIVVDHANWLGGGEIITGALVEDASDAGDWSAARVWNVDTDSMGLRAYPVYGFVGPNAI
jgi:surface antigen